MLKEHSTFIKQAIAAIDVVLIVLAFYITHGLVAEFRFLSVLPTYWPMLVGFTAFYLYFAWTRHLFSILQFNWMHGLASRVVMIFISAGILGAAILYMVPDSYTSRTFYLVFAGLAFVFIAAEKLLLKELFAQLRRSNRNTTPIILFGRGRIAAQLMQEINMHPEWGLRIVRKLDLSISPVQFEEVLKTSYIEEVFFCIPRAISREGFRIDPYLRTCEDMGRPARVFLNLSSATHFARWEYHQFMSHATLVSHTVELDPDQEIFKRAFDIAGSLVGILILMLFYPWLALAIKLTSRGPVFFKQVRVGRNGKRFVIYKFRSMYMDAEERKEELEAKNELQGAVFKLKDDPRVTPVGGLIRRLSLDEFPQFINVLKGEMSLVGTRPPTPSEVSKYQKWHHRRISTRPGITGMWQVSGRNKITDFDEIVKLDLKYIDSWSIWLDITIIFKTFLVFFRQDEAY
ncbi:MAG: exopolysaccharide biosynthesis polyprenyl glycosylphosphotransferase [Chitinivibrionales bacterium]|nr:exopolysaccharide biosynthesis polyprenyl glycosylphosphotransferase [Chitinivibrionales bacterium]MBD3357411.1 exopolysaccharide biosynthesis polyprenyl glycosylphosphotransferase [Chitinivibrionales bacterium]